MMDAPQTSKKYFVISVLLHLMVVLAIILGLDITAPMVVIENTNKQDVISAVVLGDSQKSKILPQKITQPEPTPVPVKKEEVKPAEPIPPKEIAKPKLPDPAPVKKDVIALKKPEKKPPVKLDIFGKDLLADIKKQTEKPKKVAKQKDMKAHFEKMLREQAEKSMRQHLLNEDIKMQGLEDRQAQGEVDKYKALMMQAISERWVIPPQINKKLFSVLLIRVAPNGTVIDVQVTRSSGDMLLDSSARAAVFKASPLPVPSDAAAFEAFRQFNLKMKPENIIRRDA